MVVGCIPSRESECDGLRETTNRKQGDHAEKRSLFVHNDRFLDKVFFGLRNYYFFNFDT